MKDDVLPQFITAESLEKSFGIFYIAGDAIGCAGARQLKIDPLQFKNGCNFAP